MKACWEDFEFDMSFFLSLHDTKKDKERKYSQHDMANSLGNISHIPNKLLEKVFKKFVKQHLPNEYEDTMEYVGKLEDILLLSSWFSKYL